MCERLIFRIAVLGVVLTSVAQAADPDLIGWWKLDEGSGTVTTDSSGNGHDGSLINGPVWTGGVSGRALEFDGIDDYVLCAERGGAAPGTYPHTLMPAEGFTIACWAKLQTFAYFGSFVGNGIDTGDDECGFFFYNFGWTDDNGQDFGLAIRTETGMSYVETPNIYEIDTWYHLAATYDGENVTIYVDGAVSVGPEPVGGPIRWVSATSGNYPERFAIGVWLDPGYDLWVDGAIDEVRYYSRALGQEEIVSVMKSNAALSSEPSPADRADDVPRDAVLAWTAGAFAATHDVYFGTVFEDVNAASRADSLGVLAGQGQAATTYDPAGLLDFDQTYYWRVDEVNAAPDNTVYKGDVWSFTTEPLGYPIANVAVTTNGTSDEGAGPENAVNGSGLNTNDQHSIASGDMWLAVPAGDPLWIQFEFDRLYKLHELWVWNYNVQFEPVLGFGLQDVTAEYSENGTDWTVLADVTLAQATARSDYTHNTTIDFAGVAAQYVRLNVHSGYGLMGKYGLSEVRFSYIPAHARQPQPTDGQTGVDPDTVLAWRAGREAVAHDVYFGPDPEALPLVDTVTETSYAPGALDLGTTYYWKVNEVNAAEAKALWEGTVWSFATREVIVVDDFESYTDDLDAGLAIFQTWIDGWTNETGSTVGHLDAPFAERGIVRGGAQSMPLAYDNSASPWYSETERTFDGLADWTASGADSLVLYIQGQVDNAPEALYVAIEDSAGTVAAVTHPDSAAILTATDWQPWVIPLAEFSSAGVQVNRVRMLYIGIGDRTNAAAGGTGLIYIDDVQFGRPGSAE